MVRFSTFVSPADQKSRSTSQKGGDTKGHGFDDLLMNFMEPGNAMYPRSVSGDSGGSGDITRRRSIYLQRRRKASRQSLSSSVDFGSVSSGSVFDIIDSELKAADQTQADPASETNDQVKKPASCIEILETDELSDSDPEETCDGHKTGEEITEDLFETAFEICSERFYYSNAPNAIALELRNTWLRVMEAELLDEYKPEIGHLAINVFQPDSIPPPLPFDTWSRGTLEVLDLDQQGPAKSKSGLLYEAKDVASTDSIDPEIKLPPPSDAAYSERSSLFAEGEGGEGDMLRPSSLTVLFRGRNYRRKLLSTSKLTPEDGFNIPTERQSPMTSELMKPPLRYRKGEIDQRVRSGGLAIGEDELDILLPVEEKKRTVYGSILVPNTGKMPVAGLMPEDPQVQPSNAIQAHEVPSRIKIRNTETVARQREAAKERLRMSKVVDPAKKQQA